MHACGEGPGHSTHLDKVDTLDVVLDLLNQLHFVHRLCLCQAHGEMCAFFRFGQVFLLCRLGEQEWDTRRKDR